MKLDPPQKQPSYATPIDKARALDVKVKLEINGKADHCIEDIIPIGLLSPNYNSLIVSVFLAIAIIGRPLNKNDKLLREHLVVLNKLEA